MTIVILLPGAGPHLLSPRLRVTATPPAAPGRADTKGWIGLTDVNGSGTDARCAGGLSVASTTSLTWVFTLERAKERAKGIEPS
jgi:hypothetical protein